MLVHFYLDCIALSSLGRTNDKKKTILSLKFYPYVFIKLTFSVNGIWIKISFDTNHKKRPQGEEVQVWILLNLLNMRPRDAQFIGFMASGPHDRFWSNSILFILTYWSIDNSLMATRNSSPELLGVKPIFSFTEIALNEIVPTVWWFHKKSASETLQRYKRKTLLGPLV